MFTNYVSNLSPLTLAITLILMTLIGVINTVRYWAPEHIQAVLDL